MSVLSDRTSGLRRKANTHTNRSTAILPGGGSIRVQAILAEDMSGLQRRFVNEYKCPSCLLSVGDLSFVGDPLTSKPNTWPATPQYRQLSMDDIHCQNAELSLRPEVGSEQRPGRALPWCTYAASSLCS